MIPFYELWIEISIQTSMMLVFFATLNGASIFIFPKINDRLFSGNALKLWIFDLLQKLLIDQFRIICGIWLDAIVETCIETFTDCNKAFRAEGGG